jgi:hypothetical protein
MVDMGKTSKLNRPVKVTGWSTANLYKDDLDYLKEHGVPVAKALRDALHEHVLEHRARHQGKPNTFAMSKEERSRWILSTPDDFKPGVHKEYTHAPTREFLSRDPWILDCGSTPDMHTWTQAERDAWILDGTIPLRVMMVNRTAGMPAVPAPGRQTPAG